jgi:CelD/BcsL family acetyltransferase involved in cellulose biosynthesis
MWPPEDEDGFAMDNVNDLRPDGNRESSANHADLTDRLANGAMPSLRAARDLDGWAPQWDRLVDLAPVPSPFLRSWWLTGVRGARPQFLLAVHGDQLLGGLALEEGRQMGLPRFRMMGAGLLCPDHLDLLARPGHEDAVARAVRAWLSRPGARLLDAEGLHPGSLLIKALPGRIRCEPLAGAPWTPLSGDADAYLAARPRNFRRNLRKARTRMEAEGVTHRISRGSSVAQSLETLRRLHAIQWAGRSRFLPAFDRFAAACRLGAERDEVAVHDLHIGETVIAIMVSFEVAGRVSLYQSARLTESRWRDATVVLLAAIITDACDRGFAEVDLLRGDEAYKSNFAHEQRELLRLWMANGRSGQIALGMETAARKAKRMAVARSTPAGRRYRARREGKSDDRLSG